MSQKIADYGLIGNCRSGALVSKNGSIDWAALPDFDSESFFCKLLDETKGGYFSISPVGFYQSSQIYKENTNILKTDFFNHTGRIILTDLMPLNKKDEYNNSIPEKGLKFLRRIKSKQGRHKIRIEIKVTPNFARENAFVKINSSGVEFTSKNSSLFLYAPLLKFAQKNEVIFSEVSLEENEEIFLLLGFFEKGKIANLEQVDPHQIYKETLDFWNSWVGFCRYKGVFEKEVVRSALTLKLLTFSPTGAVLAAPTTSLPEKIGGSLNWDYRYVWLRDASFTMYAFLGLGYLKEAAEFMNWLEKVCLTDGSDIQIMYGIRGEKILKERIIENLSGYENSIPVRTGNNAFKQKQLDIYGEVLTCINIFVNSGGLLSEGMKTVTTNLINACATKWKEKDAGIWEPREGYTHHTYSKLMCWVGIDRGLSIAKKLRLSIDVVFLTALREEIKKNIIENGFNKDLGAFVEYYGSDVIDSSNLNIPLVGFLPATDPMVLSTLNISMTKLTKDWFVFRTDNEADSLKSGEGSFFLATFWVIDTLTLLGRTKEAKIWLEKLIYFASPLGLYAEQFDPITKEHLGNFPQAFTHLGLINSVLNLNEALKSGAEERALVLPERLKKVVRYKIEDTFELLVPSKLHSLWPKERRRTRKHSGAGRLYQKLFKKDS